MINDCVAFVDLDDTLFSSLRRQRPGDDLVAAATLVDGSVVCYANRVQQAIHGMLGRQATIVPVTARSVAAFRRVLIPFSGPAICSHGATILAPDGAVDDHWRRTMLAPLAAARGPLEEFVAMAALLHDGLGTPLRTWLVDDGGDPAYAVIKHPHHDEDAIRELAETVVADWLLGHPGFQLHVNGNNLAVLPPGLGKAAAVAHMIAELHGRGHASVVIGAADSDTDLDFLELCDIMLLPSRSQLGNSLRRGVGGRQVAHG
jgi:hypothetical protein